ncbi:MULTISPECIES: copper homeostasis membrane protein CopD [Cupriavidus]|uniref:Copper homeostasis membrane protein CopD n=1 Tax=Cupriavidus campinensis TaxID=151783 RepID=A0ABY3EV96_9BURK|nr:MULTISPECIES: copper homeostasis membrane protein CopD [Cupriavidus]TSP14643.1 copper homeostasis membrane protein CopD [Cupriavidus campinensis]
MEGWGNIIVRFVSYTDLMLLFGLPLFGLYGVKGNAADAHAAFGFRRLFSWLAGVGLLVSGVGMLMLAVTMSGVAEFGELERHVFGMIITGTNVGIAWVVKIATLVGILFCAGFYGRSPTASLALASLLAAVGLSTLVWSGHGAMDTGTRGGIHLAADTLHLLGAGAWLGALAAFLLLLLRPVQGDAYRHLLLLRQAVTGFSAAGTLIVAVLIVTGVVNYLLIVGPSLQGMASSLYGILLLVKLGLFGTMLALAAANRFRLGPLLERARSSTEIACAKRALCKSLAIEATAMTLILLAVAWLGTLSPPGNTRPY